MSTPSIFPTLDSDQQAAMTLDPSSRTAIVAGAGSGKTTTLTARAAYVRKHAANKTGTVLCITYANEAAKEAHERLEKLMSAPRCIAAFSHLEAQYPDIRRSFWAGTLHSFAKNIIEEAVSPRVWFTLPQAERDQLNSITMLFDQLARSGGYIRNIMEGRRAEDLWETLMLNDSELGPSFMRWPRKREQICGVWAGRQASQMLKYLVPAPLASMTEKEARKHTWHYFDITEQEQYIAALYQSEKQAQTAVDYDDMIWMAAAVIMYIPHIREHYRQALSHVLVDEAQDITFLDYVLLSALPGFDPTAGDDHIGYTLVGDPRQEIYDFRAGQPGLFNMLIQSNWANDVQYLGTNYRCAPEIVELSSQIAQNAKLKMAYEPTDAQKPHAAPGARPGTVDWTLLEKGQSADATIYGLIVASLQEPRFQTRVILTRTNYLRKEVLEMLGNIQGATERFQVATIHSAKGREWDHVILVGLAKDKFPCRPSFWRSPEENLRSESRLFYVAATRAKQRLDIFEATNGVFWSALYEE